VNPGLVGLVMRVILVEEPELASALPVAPVA